MARQEPVVAENPPQTVKYPRGKHPNSQKNLKPYPPGENGGVHGHYSLTSTLKDILRDKKKREALALSTYEGAMLREPTPFKEVWDRVEGKLVEKHLVAEVDVVFIIGKGYQEKAIGGT